MYLRQLVRLGLLFGVLLFIFTNSAAFNLPSQFENVLVIDNLNDPDSFAFSPDGRMFISERITGRLLIAKYNGTSQTWVLNAQPFFTFDIPTDGAGTPQALRSAGLRDIAFDPDFTNNGLIYVFYMKDTILQNRVVRLQASVANPDLADLSFGINGEELLFEMPFNNTQASGSHNGGAVEFGGDGKLYITTGDGWESEFAGDPVQSLTTYTGKVFRLNPDGSIPTDNPFYNQTTGNYRAIYALGLRNPFSMSRHSETGLLYINEARGLNKADIYLVEAGANYGHEGTGIGTPRSPWANASGAGSELITGGAWYPVGGIFPATYHGAYFTALWGGNSEPTGQISYIQSNNDTSVFAFETDVGTVGSNGISVKPVITRIGPDGNLYYMLTTYTTSSGEIRMIRYTALETVDTPTITPQGGIFATDVQVSLATTTASADIYYSLDGNEPTLASTLYSAPFTINADTIVRVKAFLTGFNPSGTASAIFLIGDQPANIPPEVNAGVDQTVFVGTVVTLDGSATTDPDGDDAFLTDEQWTQLSGSPIQIVDSTEEIAFFTPTQLGVYLFRLEASDGRDVGSDEVTITVLESVRVEDGLVVLYTFEEGSGNVVHDTSGMGTPLDLTIPTAADVTWLAEGGLVINNATTIMAAGEKVTNACLSTNEITLEAWVKPAATNQSGPARIISLSTDLFNRNFTLGQDEDRYDVRLRTTTTSDNGIPSLASPANTLTTELTHFVYTRDVSGTARLHLNGVTQLSSSVGGDFSNWDDSYRLLLVNELTDDRPWLGELHLVAIYCRALTQDEVWQNYSSDASQGGSALLPWIWLPLVLK